ncbi:hypothetical protein HW555_010966 [Spodoptera exigua]|uniref:Peptidase aspartic putative domain-containing protein n=1 Tax=Spodoptera exigua TaxID=7107 RepID=A0A835G8J4_SPOEX|nr:hypothetical protein HW555_010966 [Spodoptera exigua]
MNKSPSRLQSCTSTQQTSVLLSTTLVDVLGSDGTFHTARCLLDNGSTSSYVTKNLCTRLNLTLESINGSVSGHRHTETQYATIMVLHTIKTKPSRHHNKMPDFLRNDDNKCWPEQPRHLSVSDLPEIRSQSHLTHTDENSFIHNYSNFNKLTRIVAYMLRFVNCCREKQNNSNKNKKLCVGQIKPLNTVELNNARYQLAKIIQQHSFPDEYLLLLNNKKLPVGHKLNSLNPFLDEFQLIRVGEG